MFPPAADPAQVVDLAVRAEELGYDFLACGEHLFFHGPHQNSFVTLAAAAAVTSRIRLLSAVTLLPLYPAALAAKQASILDRISQGRFDFGVGMGGEFPPEFAATGTSVRERGTRTEEALTLIRQLFSGNEVDFSGEFSCVKELRLDPPPIQPGGPPIWVGGRKERALHRAVRHGDVWFPYVIAPEQFHQGMIRLREIHDEVHVEVCGQECGGSDSDSSTGREEHRPVPQGAFFGWGAVDLDSAKARESATSVVSRVYRQDFAPLADRYLVAGSPQEVVDRLGAYAAAGASHYLFAPAASDAQSLSHMIDLFADQVVPHVQDVLPARLAGGPTSIPQADRDRS